MNFKRSLLGITLLLTFQLRAQDPMTALVDQQRVLLLFAPAATDPGFTRQQHLLQDHASELADRDLIVIPVLDRWTPDDAALRQSLPALTSDAEQKLLRHRYNIKPREYVVLLLGKDGGEKLRSHTPVTMEELSHRIDSMPMRQQELRQRNRPNPGK